MLSFLSLPIPQTLAILFRTQRTSRMKFVIQKRETKLRLKLLNKQMSKMCWRLFASASCHSSLTWLVNRARFYVFYARAFVKLKNGPWSVRAKIRHFMVGHLNFVKLNVRKTLNEAPNKSLFLEKRRVLLEFYWK